MTQRILMFAMSPARQRDMEAVCAPLGVSCTAVPPACYDMRVGELASGSAVGAGFSMSAPFPEEMLIFCYMDSARIDAFLAAVRQAGIPQVGRKAVLTPTNLRWTARELYRELDREHRALAH